MILNFRQHSILVEVLEEHDRRDLVVALDNALVYNEVKGLAKVQDQELLDEVFNCFKGARSYTLDFVLYNHYKQEKKLCESNA